jgi:L-ascorbate metabolism protein UlaG (beta-lactamase superfamily)
MKLHHLRNTTFVIESGEKYILIDPMLADKGTLPPFARFKHQSKKNPLVSLPDNATDILNKVTNCLITHSQKFGIKALQHTDHLDTAGESFLIERNIPIATREQDASYLKKHGLTIEVTLNYWQSVGYLDGKITAVPALHGYGWIRGLMANGAGLFLQLPDEPSIYISGDTVYTKDVERALIELHPDIAVMASGSASLDVGGPILMPMEELITFAKDAPGEVVANHLEALNHCPTTRSQLKQELESNGLLSKVYIPNDGDVLTFQRDRE